MIAVTLRLRLLPRLRLHQTPHNHYYNRYLSTTTGYQSIGSFHSENPEDLLRIPDDAYQPPPLPFDDTNASSSSNNDAKDDFMLDQSWTFLNHGAFGASLSCGYDRAQQWRYHLEQQPLRYFDRDLLPHLTYSTRRLAQFMNTSPTNLALLPNTTTGMNTVIQGYVREYKQDGKILLWETTYGSVKKMARVYCGHVHEISFLEEMMNDGGEDSETIICRALEQYLDAHSEVYWKNALLIVDQTASNTALNFPIQALSKIAKQHDMIVTVDGAHGLLAQPLDTVLKYAHIYISNGHKWLSCPRGVAVMHCNSTEIQETILRIPAIVSHGVDDGFFNRFVWDGTRDYAAALAVPVVLDHWERVGVENVRRQMKETLTQAVSLLSELWHHDSKECTTLAPMHMHSPMALVRLPPCITTALGEATSNDAKRIQDYLYHNHIEVPIKCIQGCLYVRLSCHVYNALADYKRLGHVMLQY